MRGYRDPRQPVHPFVRGPGTPLGLFPTPQLAETPGAGRPSWDHSTPLRTLHKTSVEGGVLPSYGGYIPGGRHVIGTSASGNVPRSAYQQAEPAPPLPPTPPRSAVEMHRSSFKPARLVAQQEATLRQYRLRGVNRWAPYGVDVADDAALPPGARGSSSSSAAPAAGATAAGVTCTEAEYLAMPEEAHLLWGHAARNGGWGGYANVAERLRNTARPRSVGPHERLRRARLDGVARATDLPPPNPVHHLALDGVDGLSEGVPSGRGGRDGETWTPATTPPSSHRSMRPASARSIATTARAARAREEAVQSMAARGDGGGGGDARARTTRLAVSSGSRHATRAPTRANGGDAMATAIVPMPAAAAYSA